MINANDYLVGKGLKLVMVITADEPWDLADALQSAVDHIGMGINTNKSASDTFFYTYNIECCKETA